ncbi:MAG: helix-turn-helix transcriptional regulator [Candidatus Limiplasma sp.]|nr:helix-turn-helix transcriptional regulator [Candidatus Limiplasma sp.]
MKRIKDSEAPKPMNITGRNIREARLAAKLTQKQLSEKLETIAVYVCRGSISRIESGERIVTDIELQAISEILHVSIDQLFARKG